MVIDVLQQERVSVTVPRLSHRVSLLGRVRHATNIKPKGKRVR